MKDIRLTLVQMRSTVGDIRSNLDRMASFISSADSDIICFPEMCLSGYTTYDPGRYALDPDDPSVSKIHDLSDDTDSLRIHGEEHLRKTAPQTRDCRLLFGYQALQEDTSGSSRIKSVPTRRFLACVLGERGHPRPSVMHRIPHPRHQPIVQIQGCRTHPHALRQRELRK